MAISELYNGAAVTIDTVELSLTTTSAGPDIDTNDGIYQIFIDLNALQAGDCIEFKIYETVVDAGTQRLVYSARFADIQGVPVWVSPSLILLHGWDMTLKKIRGTDRAVNWSIRRLT